eukprot:scaffold1659_cov255-Pinguiococcus_pyrenoidosus.AAC.44
MWRPNAELLSWRNARMKWSEAREHGVRELDPLIIENLEKVDVYVDEVKDQALVKLREGKDIVVEKVREMTCPRHDLRPLTPMVLP